MYGLILAPLGFLRPKYIKYYIFTEDYGFLQNLQYFLDYHTGEILYCPYIIAKSLIVRAEIRAKSLVIRAEIRASLFF